MRSALRATLQRVTPEVQTSGSLIRGRLPIRFGAGRSRAESTFRHSPRDLVLAHDDQIGAAALQVLDFSVGMGARDNLDLRVCRSPLLDDLPGLKSIGNGDQKATRFGQIRRVDHLRRGGITVNRFDTAARNLSTSS